MSGLSPRIRCSRPRMQPSVSVWNPHCVGNGCAELVSACGILCARSASDPARGGSRRRAIQIVKPGDAPRTSARGRSRARPRAGAARRVSSQACCCAPAARASGARTCSCSPRRRAAGVIDRPRCGRARSRARSSSFCLLSSATYLSTTCATASRTGCIRASACARSRRANSSPRAALALAAALAIAGIALATAIAPELGAVGVRLPRADRELLAVVAAGGPARHRSRSPAASCCARSPAASRRDVYLSRWFLVVTACCAVFLVAGEAPRRAARARRRAPARATLRRYSLGVLRSRCSPPRRSAAIAYASGRSRGRSTSSGTSCRSCRSCCGSAATRC